MFKLRQEHLKAFSQLTLESFLNRGVSHLRKHFPSRVEDASDDDLRNWIRSCIPRAGAYGLTSQYEVMCFVDATILLGADFDSEPNYRLAAQLLCDASKPNQKRAKLLLDEALRRR